MRINHNIPALQASMNLKRTEKQLSKSMQKLSSGLKINSAKDDAAGLAIANKLDVQARALERASSNAMDGISLIQTAEGALNEVHNMLQRMRELAIESANDTLEPDDREKIQMEIEQLTDEITATANKTEFNKIKILGGECAIRQDGSGIGGLTLQVGPNYNMALKAEIPVVNSVEMGLYDLTATPPVSPYLDYTTKDGSLDALDKVDEAIAYVSNIRGNLGAYQNRLEMTVRNLDTSAINIEASRSRIQDTDIAKETTYYTQRTVMEQAGISVLAQANQRPQQILSLMK